MADRLKDTLLSTTYEDLVNGAVAIKTSHWYSIGRYGKKEEGTGCDEFLSVILTVEDMAITYKDPEFGKLATGIKATVETLVGYDHFGNYNEFTYQMPKDNYQIDWIGFEKEGIEVETLIYHTPSMAYFSWTTDQINTDVYNIQTGKAVIVLKNCKVPVCNGLC
jgi:hypothetical protein